LEDLAADLVVTDVAKELRAQVVVIQVVAQVTAAVCGAALVDLSIVDQTQATMQVALVLLL
jgi:hypothetical protein